MPQEKQIRILVYGLGAIGGFYALILGRNPEVSLSVVARSNYEVVKSEGLTIESQNHGRHVVRPAQTFKLASEANATFDYVVCTHKAIDQEAVAEKLRPAVDDNTTIVIIQNGVGNEEPFRTAFPDNTIISCVTWVGATQVQPGLIKHTKAENMEIGLLPNAQVDANVERERLDRFVGYLRHGKTIFTVEDDIQVKRWEKVVWNAAWNPLTTLTMVDTQTWLKCCEESMAVTRRLMQEVVDVARAVGVPLKDTLIDELIQKILALPGTGSSMQTDAKEGRPLEVDVILGTPMRKARELEMDVPVLAAIYAMTVAVDQRLRQAASH
ncbi:hypothetical protein MBLNU459_g4205t1 [Dothideomycetes sp. NU459]